VIALLTSMQNDQVKKVVNLHKRKFREETGEFLVEGWRFVQEAILRGAEITKVFVCPERQNDLWFSMLDTLNQKNVPIVQVDEKVIQKMSDTENPQGIVAVVVQPKWTWEDLEINSNQVILVLDGIQDPGNCGTILRTALAAGIRQVCITEGTVDLYNPKVLRSTMGAIFSLKSVSHCQPEEILDFCAKHEVQVVTGDISGENLYKAELPLPLALVVGNEGKGPSPIFQGPGASRVTIPMNNGVESLNVAMATGIMLYEIVRRRTEKI
jgi:RNA methyltransferase, TrmH family